MKTPKGQQSGQISFQRSSFLKQPMGKNAKVIPAPLYSQYLRLTPEQQAKQQF